MLAFVFRWLEQYDGRFQMKAILDRRKDLRSGVEELVDTANENGGKDNIAVVVVEQG